MCTRPVGVGEVLRRSEGKNYGKLRPSYILLFTFLRRACFAFACAFAPHVIFTSLLRYFFVLLPLLIGMVACGKTTNQQGRALYEQHCANCHMKDGQGLALLIPPLAGADYLRDYPAAVVQGVRYGMTGPMVVNGRTYNEAMPANSELSEFQIVNIVNYINQAWGNDYGQITVAQARAWLATPEAQ